MSVFTVEPPINRNVDDYEPKNKSGDTIAAADKISAAERRIELQSYADAVRTVLLGNP
jgi:septation ring formation regulator EzrA